MIWEIRVHIIDYKTGKIPEKSDWMQLHLHALILAREVPYPIKKASFLYLSSGLLDTIDLEESVLDHARWELLATAREIRAEQHFRPSPGPVCRGCDLKAICPAPAVSREQESEATDLCDYVFQEPER